MMVISLSCVSAVLQVGLPLSLSCVSAALHVCLGTNVNVEYRDADGDICKLCICCSSGLATMMVISLSCVSVVLQD